MIHKLSAISKKRSMLLRFRAIMSFTHLNSDFYTVFALLEWGYHPTCLVILLSIQKLPYGSTKASSSKACFTVL